MSLLLLVACHGAPEPPADGQLAPCWSTPNCVSSQAAPDDPHHIAPLDLPDVEGDAVSVVAEVVRQQEGATEVVVDGRAIRATFQTPSGVFTDDVHLWVDPEAGVVHVRSSSRLGIRDFGVNRDRVEALRSAL